MTFGPQSLTYALIVCGGLAVLFAYLVYESFRLSGIDVYAPEPLWRQRVNKAASVVAFLLICDHSCHPRILVHYRSPLVAVELGGVGIVVNGLPGNCTVSIGLPCLPLACTGFPIDLALVSLPQQPKSRPIRVVVDMR